MKLKLPIAFFLIIFLFSCEEEKVPKPFYPRNDHEAYEKSLENANLLSTALGKDWQELAIEALDNPEEIELPYEEAFFVDSRSAYALGYSFKAKRGQKIKISISEVASDTMRRFVDLFRVEEMGLNHIASADSTGHLLGFEPRKDGQYILRFQSELLRGGTFKITFENVPTLKFPVAGHSFKSIRSFWGDPRDGGSRKHEGIDIFAPKGTPVIAPTDGFVKDAYERGIGGKVIWLTDSKRIHTFYFAHLDDYKVKKGERVKMGDTLGFVGTSGNAHIAVPHLHFGVYKKGPIDPLSHLKAAGLHLQNVKRDLHWLGKEIRIKSNTKLYADQKGQQQLSRLEKYQVAQVISMNASLCRIQLPDGQVGYVNKSELSNRLNPIFNLSARQDFDLMFKPDFNTKIGLLERNEVYDVIGKNLDYLLVKTSSGKTGWINPDAKKSGTKAEEE